MKKIVCILLSVIMSVSLVSFPTAAQAETTSSVDSSVFKSNVERLKSNITQLGIQNVEGNKMIKYGNYCVVYDSSDDTINFLADIVNNKGDIIGNINMYYDYRFNSVYFGPRIKITSSPWDFVADVYSKTAEDYIYGQNLDFGIMKNNGSKSNEEIVQMCNQLFKDAIDGWNKCLSMYVMPLLRQLGFCGLCQHNFSRSYFPASTGADGSYKDYCKSCGYYEVTSIPSVYDIKINSDKFYYNGSVQRPTVSVTDKYGNPISSEHYTVTYSNPNSTAVENYYLIVKLNEPYYTGSKTLVYTIEQKSGSSLISSNTASTGKSNSKNSTSKPKAVQIKKLTPAKKSLTVTWAQGKSINGYQIQLATDKKFKKNKKSVTIKKQKTTKTTVKKLKSKKKYYVRVRTYKTVNGKKVYSAWSKTKSVKVK